jgi:uncharacterized protein YjiS (DUF1127 family)
MSILIQNSHSLSANLEEFLHGLFVKAVGSVANHLRRFRDMNEIRELATFEDRSLRDLGLTRGDLYWASRLPVEEHATERLQRIARRQS